MRGYLAQRSVWFRSTDGTGAGRKERKYSQDSLPACDLPDAPARFKPREAVMSTRVKPPNRRGRRVPKDPKDTRDLEYRKAPKCSNSSTTNGDALLTTYFFVMNSDVDRFLQPLQAAVTRACENL